MAYMKTLTHMHLIILSTREETLNSSQNFSELLAKVKENRDKQFNNAKYSTSNQPINIDNYIEKISKPAILNEVSKQPQTKDNSTKDKPNSVSAKIKGEKSQSAGNPAGTKPNKGGGARGDGEL